MQLTFRKVAGSGRLFSLAVPRRSLLVRRQEFSKQLLSRSATTNLQNQPHCFGFPGNAIVRRHYTQKPSPKSNDLSKGADEQLPQMSLAERRKVIEDIRQLYGIGFDVADDRARSALDMYQKQQSGSLRLLSRELYSVQTHFVLEYIQNADDNKYLPGAAPMLRILVDDRTIDFINNERGFSADNVRALCAVGMSTKKAVGGYIGEKGIGFKAGFTVANQIQVFSNGFHFEFHEASDIGALGFVVPQWIDAPAPIKDQTVIRLFLKPDVDRVALQEQLENTARPELLLFLRQLRTLTLQINDKYISTTRHDDPDGGGMVSLETKVMGDAKLPDNVVEVVKYFRYQHTIATPGGSVNRGRGSEGTDILIVFPDAPAQIQNVFAYLPVKDYGLRFILNADFVLASSREHIAEDREWNVWLRSQIAPAYCNALMAYLSEMHRRSGQYPFQVWETVPLPGEVPAFFAPVAEAIWATLKDMRCLPAFHTRGQYDSPGPEEWVSPTMLLLPPDDDLSELITNDELREATTKNFLATHTISTRMQQVYRLLGVSDFEPDHMLAILTHQGVLSSRVDKPKWFIKLYRYLGRYLGSATDNPADDSSPFAKFLPVPMVLLQSGKLVAGNSGQVYFYPHRQQYGFEHELKLVHKDLCDDAIGIEVLERLGVGSTDADMIVQNHILPQMQRGHYATVQAYVHYLANNSDHINDKLWQKVLKAIKLRDKRKQLKSPSQLILPDELNSVKTEDLFGTAVSYMDDSFVHAAVQQTLGHISAESANTPVRDEYVKENQLSIGTVSTILEHAATGRRSNLEQTPSEIEYAKWHALLEELHISRLFPFQGQDCSAFPNMVAAALSSKGKDGLVRMLEMTSSVWDSMQEQLAPQKNGKPSPFLNRLRTTTWIVTSKGETVAPLRALVWQRTPEIEAVFGDAVPYCMANVSVECATALGIHTSLSVPVVLEELNRLSGDAALFARVYLYLFREYRSNSQLISNAFTSRPLLFTLAGMKTLPEVVWSDPKKLIRSVGDLSQTFSGNPDAAELQAFFVGDLKVLPEPAIADYMAELNRLVAEPLTPESVPLVGQLLEQLSQMLSDGAWSEAAHEQWRELLTKPIFPAQWGTNNVGWATRETVFVNDDEEATPHLAQAGVKFLAVADELIPKLAPLLQLSGLHGISETVKSELVQQQQQQLPPPEAALTTRLQTTARFVLRFLFHRNPRAYQANRRWLHQLANVQAIRLPVVTVRRHACGVTWDTHPQCSFSSVATTSGSSASSQNVLAYVAKSCTETDWIAELARAVSVEPLVIHAICSAGDCEALFASLKLTPLPASELKAIDAAKQKN